MAISEGTITALIDAQAARAETMASAAVSAIDSLKSSVRYTQYGYLPAADTSRYNFTSYVAPAGDTSAMPVYTPPTTTLPVSPTLADVSAIPKPVFPTTPTIDISTLFRQVAPSTNIPAWTVTAPDLKVDYLVAQMDALTQPTLRTLDFPVIAKLVLDPVPAVTIPSYIESPRPDVLADPQDYAAIQAAKYRQMLPEMQAYIDGKVSTWLSQYAPEYNAQLATLTDRLNAGMTGTVLPDQIEAAMITRARSRAQTDFQSTEQSLLDSYKKSGLTEPPGALMAALQHGRLKNADALANQSTDIYIERRKMEVQHLQFVLNLCSSNINSIRGLAIQYAGMIGNTIQQSLAFANTSAELATKAYDHLIAKSNLCIQVMQAVDQQYQTKLKAALSALDGYRLKLDAEKAKKDVEIMQLNVVEAEYKAQQQEVDLYAALIEAISRKASVETLKIQNYEIQGKAYALQLNAIEASFNVYQAALSGDKSKMEGEMSKLRIFEDQLKGIALELEANIKATESTIEVNKAKTQIYEAKAGVYKVDLETCLQRFTAQAEVKKLFQEIYKTQLGASIDIYKQDLAKVQLQVESVLRAYEGNIRAFETTGRLNVSNMGMYLNTGQAIAGAYAQIAGASAGALNSNISAVSSG
jgi:hypothetical protein